jgi:hypothetical protein
MFKTVINIYLWSFFLTFSQAVFAGGFVYYAHINKYTKCEALQNVLANILSESEQEFYQHEAHHDSLDSRIVALEFAGASNYKESLVDELYASYLDEYRALLKESEDVEVFAASLKLPAEKCHQLNEMQADIILRKRKQNEKANR